MVLDTKQGGGDEFGRYGGWIILAFPQIECLPPGSDGTPAEGYGMTMCLFQKWYLRYEERRLRRFLLRKGMEKLAQAGTNIQIEGEPTLFIQDKDPLNRVFLKTDNGRPDIGSILLTASDEYPKDFRRYVACCKLLK